MPKPVSKVTVHPPPGRPSWGGHGNLPLIYLGWGRRDFAKNPLPVHYDRGTNYFILVSGEIVLSVGNEQKVVQGPSAILIDSDCRFGITQKRRETVSILVWVWKNRPQLPELQLTEGASLTLDLSDSSLDVLKDLHSRCR